MKHLLRIPLFISLLVASGMSMAAAISSGSLNTLMDISGINKQMAGIPASIVAGMQQSRQQGAPLSDAQFTEIKKVVVDSFKPAEITASIADKLQASLSESDAGELLAWYHSDLGKKITRMEEQASTPAAQQQMISQAKALLGDEKRVAAAQRIDELVNASDMAMEFQKNTATAVFSALSKAINPGQPVDMEGFEKRLASQAPQMRQQLKQIVTLSIVYNYKDLSQAELDKYMAFLEKPTTRKFNDNAVNGMRVALNDSINTMADSLARVFTASAE